MVKGLLDEGLAGEREQAILILVMSIVTHWLPGMIIFCWNLIRSVFKKHPEHHGRRG